MSDRINDQLADLKAGQAALTAETRNNGTTLASVHADIRKLLDDHEVRIRRLEWAVIAIALGSGGAAAKLFGLL